MNALTIFVFCLVALIVASIIFLPMLKYKLSVRDVLKFYFNDRYQLFVFAHSRFAKVLDGKQTYERYRDYIKTLYDKDNYTKTKSEHDNNRRRIDLCFLSEVVEDEQFVRQYFSDGSFPFDKFSEMNDEWEMRPTNTETTDTIGPLGKDDAKQVEVPISGYQGRLKPEERTIAGSFSKLIVNRDKADSLYKWIDRTLKTINERDEYAALALALKASTLIEYTYKNELYECINSSFSSKIKITYNDFSQAIKQYTENTCREVSEERIREYIEKFSSELNEI